MSKNNNSSYDDALQELQTIVQQLQDNQIPVDELSAKIKRAARLIEYCQEKLRSTEENIQELFTRS
ncbi:MAG TPA: exodeoxyribonuclease VII small subunit [Saprospiraceae bacterium]|nr:exodeoxyribonuclease VII small subunit [Saprospiraceae bacterium]